MTNDESIMDAYEIPMREECDEHGRPAGYDLAGLCPPGLGLYRAHCVIGYFLASTFASLGSRQRFRGFLWINDGGS